MTYEVWDFEASNKVDAFPSKDAALAEVAAQIVAFGREAVEMWMLVENDGLNTSKGLRRIAYGIDLAEIATHPAASVPAVRTAN